MYNSLNFIGQFVTILSVNKTREPDGRIALIFCWVQSRSAPKLYYQEKFS